MKVKVVQFICMAATTVMLTALPAFASGGDDNASPTPTASASATPDDHGADPSPTASASATPDDHGIDPSPTASVDDHGVDPSPTASASASPDDHGVDPSPTASGSPDDNHHGGDDGHPSPAPSASASPGDNDHGGGGGDDLKHGKISLHGLFEGATASGGVAILYVDKGTHLQVNILDVAGQTIGFAEGEMANNAFTFTLSNGQSVSGTADEHSISGTVGSDSFQAQRAEDFGPERDIAGRFTGIAVSGNTQSTVLIVIDTEGRMALVQATGSAPNFTRTGGFGSVTPPTAPNANFTFTLDKTIGSSSPIIGSFTIADGVFQGTFTTSAGTFTVNSFKSSLAGRMANISTRGLVGSGDGQLIGGFIITGGPKLVLIRAIGPSLAALGVSPALDNPSLQLFAGQNLLASNDDWKSNANQADIVASGLAPTNDLEAAILVRLEPGAYTTVVSGTATSAVGIGLVEVYEVGSD